VGEKEERKSDIYRVWGELVRERKNKKRRDPEKGKVRQRDSKR
jgi:hypothetical protein